ncbi:MAG TPA: type II secretion system protein G [Thermoanaerobaculia bacterium]|nr:type II secretion system protein G [Thermoanaerobaculia bacterium]
MRARAALLVILLALACHREKEDASRDAALKQTLTLLRSAIAAYQKDQGTYPSSLAVLVPRYLRRIPADPLTGSANWRVTTEESVTPSSDFTTGTAAASTSVVVDVNSAAPGADRNGTPYANY